eukprot:scaffold759_cov119-Isochrysis_galbana.AAC.5
MVHRGSEAPTPPVASGRDAHLKRTARGAQVAKLVSQFDTKLVALVRLRALGRMDDALRRAHRTRVDGECEI